MIPLGIVNQQAIAGGAGMVVSIETIEVNLTGDTEQTINLTAGQNHAQCVPFISWKAASHTDTSNSSINNSPQPEMKDNSGTPAIRLYFDVGANTTYPSSSEVINVRVHIVEFSEDIRVQQKTWTASGTTTNITITAVDQAYTFLLNYYRADRETTGYNRQISTMAQLTSTTNLRQYFYQAGTKYPFGVTYVIEDLTQGDHFSVQTVHSSSALVSDTENHTTTIDKNKSMLFATYFCTYNSDNPNYGYVRAEIDAGGASSTMHIAASGGTTEWYGYVVTFTKCNVRHVSDVQLSGTTYTSDNTITAVDTEKATPLFCPMHYFQGEISHWHQNYDKNLKCDLELTSATNVRLTRRNVDTTTYFGAFTVQVIEWDMG